MGAPKPGDDQSAAYRPDQDPHRLDQPNVGLWPGDALEGADAQERPQGGGRVVKALRYRKVGGEEGARGAGLLRFSAASVLRSELEGLSHVSSHLIFGCRS